LIEEGSPRGRGLCRIDVGAHGYFRIARLQGCVHQVTGYYRVITASTYDHRKMIRGVVERG
jgi:hypothetical protein